MLAFATPTLLIAWAFCRFATISAASKVFLIRMALVKSLVIDVVLVGGFGLFSSTFPVLQLGVFELPDAVSALIANVFVIGVLAMLGTLSISVILGERIRRKSLPAKRSTLSLVEGLWSQLDVQKPIRVRVSDEIECASVAGILSPTILLPRDVSQVGATEILHEIAHVQNRDLVWTFATKVCQSVFFILPWAHWFATEAHLWQEISADHMATFQSTARRYELAEAIIRMTSKSHSPVLSMSGAGKNVARRLDFLYRPVRASWTSLAAYSVLLASMAPIPVLEVQARAQGGATAVRTKTMARIVPAPPAAVATMDGEAYSPMASKM